MAGILDTFNENFAPTGYKFQIPAWLQSVYDATQYATPVGLANKLATPGTFGNDAVKFLGQQFVVPDPNNQPPASFDQRFGSFQPPASPQQPMPQMPMQIPPQAPMPGWASQQDGAAIPPAASPTAGPKVSPALDPQQAAPSFQADFLGNSKRGFLDKLIDAFDSPAVYDAKRAQGETARGLYEIYKSQGMSPNEAASRAVIEARNPKIMEERMKPYANMEQRIANQPDSARGGNAMQQYTDFLTQKTTAEELAKKRSDAQNNRETLQLELPGLAADAAEHLRQVDALRNHEGRKGNMWWHSKAGAYLPDSSIPGNTAAGDAVARLNQIKGGAFLDAFKALKGGGQITEIEGKKATDAIARMNRATSEAEFNAALDDYSGAIKRGLDKLHASAGVQPPGGFRGNDGWQTLPGGVKIRPRQ